MAAAATVWLGSFPSVVARTSAAVMTRSSDSNSFMGSFCRIPQSKYVVVTTTSPGRRPERIRRPPRKRSSLCHSPLQAAGPPQNQRTETRSERSSTGLAIRLQPLGWTVPGSRTPGPNYLCP